MTAYLKKVCRSSGEYQFRSNSTTACELPATAAEGSEIW